MAIIIINCNISFVDTYVWGEPELRVERAPTHTHNAPGCDSRGCFGWEGLEMALRYA